MLDKIAVGELGVNCLPKASTKFISQFFFFFLIIFLLHFYIFYKSVVPMQARVLLYKIDFKFTLTQTLKGNTSSSNCPILKFQKSLKA